MEDQLYPYATGVLQAIASSILGRVERCDRHDAILNEADRLELAAVDRVLKAHGTVDELRAALDAARDSAYGRVRP
jgi:hypothetical protein